MRFKTKVDFWLVAVLGIAAPVSCIAPLLNFGLHSLLALLSPAIWLIALSFCLPQYYETREDGLFLRQGWKRSLLPYASLVELRPMQSWSSASVFSSDRILVTTSTGQRFIVAVLEQERFLAAVAQRARLLEPSGSGLSLPMAPITIL